MAIVLNGQTNDVTIDGVSVATESEVSSAIAAIPAVPDATETIAGKVELATIAEVQAGTDTTRAVTPAGLSGAGFSKLVRATSVNSFSGTAIDFTNIPSWAKRITVMFNGVSTSGTSAIQVQLGTSVGVKTTEYNTAGHNLNISTSAGTGHTSGAVFGSNLMATKAFGGSIDITNVGGNIWVYKGEIANSDNSYGRTTAGNVILSSTLDRIRITTVNGTDTFNGGSVNIMYEG